MMHKEISIEQQLFAMTTIIETEYNIKNNIFKAQASGFFFTETIPLSLPADNQDGHWEKLDKFWLITNRHVVINKVDNTEYLAEKFTFNLRETLDNSIEWYPITLTKNELKSSLLVHSNKNVDVAVINVSYYIKKILNTERELRKRISIPATLNQNNLPDKQPITIEVTSDIIVASYPLNFYDTFNKFPIIKSGIIASGWGLKFNGEPMFQIDAQLFPGSSGGLVISKPTNMTVHNGNVLYNKKSKKYVLLGVYSGEYNWIDFIDTGYTKFQQKRSYGLGNVWYAYLIT